MRIHALCHRAIILGTTVKETCKGTHNTQARSWSHRRITGTHVHECALVLAPCVFPVYRLNELDEETAIEGLTRLKLMPHLVPSVLAALANEHVHTLSQLHLLNNDDLLGLGFRLGERRSILADTSAAWGDAEKGPPPRNARGRSGLTKINLAARATSVLWTPPLSTHGTNRQAGAGSQLSLGLSPRNSSAGTISRTTSASTVDPEHYMCGADDTENDKANHARAAQGVLRTTNGKLMREINTHNQDHGVRESAIVQWYLNGPKMCIKCKVCLAQIQWCPRLGSHYYFTKHLKLSKDHRYWYMSKGLPPYSDRTENPVQLRRALLASNLREHFSIKTRKLTDGVEVAYLLHGKCMHSLKGSGTTNQKMQRAKVHHKSCQQSERKPGSGGNKRKHRQGDSVPPDAQVLPTGRQGLIEPGQRRPRRRPALQGG